MNAFEYFLSFFTPFTYLPVSCSMSQNGQTHFKNLAEYAARFLKCV